MLPFSLEQTGKNDIQAYTKDEWLFGWNPLPGIVSVWANSNGLAIIQRREEGHITCTKERFRSWLFATTLDDLTHLGSALRPVAASAEESPALMGLASRVCTLRKGAHFQSIEAHVTLETVKSFVEEIRTLSARNAL